MTLPFPTTSQLLKIIEEQYIPFDPEGQLPETSGPVWIINIADGQARSRLKVEKRGKNKGRNTKW